MTAVLVLQLLPESHLEHQWKLLGPTHISWGARIAQETFFFTFSGFSSLCSFKTLVLYNHLETVEMQVLIQ